MPGDEADIDAEPGLADLERRLADRLELVQRQIQQLGLQQARQTMTWQETWRDRWEALRAELAEVRARLPDREDWQAIAGRLAALESGAPAPEPDPFPSAAGLDYRPLNDALGSGQWQAAAEQTRSLALAAAGRSAEGWLRPEDIAAFPLEDLQTLDWLWRYWSGDRFGFAAQWQQWAAAGGDYGRFCDAVGWRRRGQWCYDADLVYSPAAPLGHLPVLTWGRRACYGLGPSAASGAIAAWMDRWGRIGGYGMLPGDREDPAQTGNSP